MIFEKVMAIGFSVMILMQAMIVRRCVGTWIFPACLFGLFWFLYTFIPLVALFTVPIDSYSIGYILLCCIAFSITASGFKWRKAFQHKKNCSDRADYRSRFIRISFYSMSAMVIISLILNTLLQGFTLQDVAFNLLETAGEYISRRYSGDLDVNVFSQLSVVLAYPAAILGGLVYAGRPKGSAGIVPLLLTVIPSVLTMLIQGNKGTLFLVMTLFWSGILIFQLNNGDNAIIAKGTIRKFLIYGLILFPVLIASFMARGLYASDDLSYVAQQLARYIASYSSGHLYAFSDWFSHLIYGRSSNEYQDDMYTSGFYTFMAAFKFFGSIKDVPPGIYEEYFQYGDVLQSNIYTLFRGLILDFGFAGSILFMLALGLFLHISFWVQLTNKRDAISTSIFAHSIGFFYTSFIISLLVWNSIYASFVLVSIILMINNFLARRISSRNTNS